MALCGGRALTVAGAVGGGSPPLQGSERLAQKQKEIGYAFYAEAMAPRG